MRKKLRNFAKIKFMSYITNIIANIVFNFAPTLTELKVLAVPKVSEFISD